MQSLCQTLPDCKLPHVTSWKMLKKGDLDAILEHANKTSNIWLDEAAFKNQKVEILQKSPVFSWKCIRPQTQQMKGGPMKLVNIAIQLCYFSCHRWPQKPNYVQGSLAKIRRHYECFNFEVVSKWIWCLPQTSAQTNTWCTSQANSVLRLLVWGRGHPAMGRGWSWER